MPVIAFDIFVRAPVEVCFDLSRDIDFHQESMRDTGERAVAGKTTGFIGLDEEVTWEAVHFGIRQRLTSRITEYDRPRRFRDSMVRGAFARFDHDHIFATADGGTMMTDRFDYTSPLGPVGRMADLLFLERYMRRLLTQRAASIKAAPEQR